MPTSADRPAAPTPGPEAAFPDDAGGLSEAEARARLARDGPNRLPAPRRRTVATATLAVLRQPMVLLLLACTALYAALGNAFDGAVLAVSVVVVAAISVSQELRTQRVLEALRDLSSPRSTVVRDGVVRRIPSLELVVGDRLVVQEGDRMACDAELLRAHGLRADESLLTGESLPVDKDSADAASRRLHAGTLVVQGDGIAVVCATGARTALGRIGGSLASIEPPASRLQAELQRLVRLVATAALVTCLFAATVFAWREGSWIAGLLVGLTLAMAIVPEEFAVVWTVMLALGARRLARAQVLTRQPQAIEALGAATVLCVDKTGTLTHNRMALAAAHDGRTAWVPPPGDGPPPAPFEALLATAAAACPPEAPDPMDRAILQRAGTRPPPGALLRREGVQPGHPFVSQCWQDGDVLHFALKGAPEAVLARCTGGALAPEPLLAQARAWGAEGWRVIAVARVSHARDGADAATAAGQAPAQGWECLGLLAFADPLREEVPAALQACREAGVRVVMITGDAPATAVAIARAAGLLAPDAAAEVLTGADIDALSEALFERQVRHTAIYARVTPAHKLRIVQALQRGGDVVAMTGDGVNDGPALRAANIGVAMGARGTDVAREAATLVLMDDRFASLVQAVAAGRRIFANLQHALGYLFAVHVPIVGASLWPLFGGPVLLLPVHVVLLELIIDPACSLVFESEPLAAGAMRAPPRPAATRLFPPGQALRALTAGGLALVPLAAVQFVGHAAGWSAETLRMAAMASIVLGNLLLLWWFRGGWRAPTAGNRRFLQVLLAVGAGTLAVALLPPLRTALGFPAAPVPVPVLLLMGAAVATLSVLAWRRRRA
jgi:Ca2+-transporting ATPase